MLEQLQERLAQLQAEYESGQNMLLDLERQQAELRETMLRIAGAIQVLQEEIEKVQAANDAAPVGSDAE